MLSNTGISDGKAIKIDFEKHIAGSRDRSATPCSSEFSGDRELMLCTEAAKHPAFSVSQLLLKSY